MIYNLPEEGFTWLLCLYNNILHNGIVPLQWRNIRIVPIPKSNPNQNSEPKLRPKSLISCLCKIFHTMITRRLERYVEKNKILSPYSTGFRKSHSCIDCLVRLVTHVLIGFSKKRPTLACFFGRRQCIQQCLDRKSYQNS